MTTFSRTQLKRLSEARCRPLAKKIGLIPPVLIKDLLSFWDENKHLNILDDALKNRLSIGVPMEGDDYLRDNYVQVELQQLKPGGDPENRKDFTVSLCPSVTKAIESIVGPAHRMRLSAVQPGATLREHVDDPEPHRVLAVLQGAHAFKVQNKTEVCLPKMEIGELWFVNTAWPHSVTNTSSNTVRIALMADLFAGPDEAVNPMSQRSVL